MARKMKVTYSDGREVTVLVPYRALVDTEANLGGVNQANALKAQSHIAWWSLHKSGKEPSDFQQFLDLIEDVEDVSDEPDPTPAPPPIDGSSSSASTPESLSPTSST